MFGLTAEQLERYSRQMLLPGIGGRGQARLREASVLVVGAGGLGAPILQYLTAAGVGRITIVDPDRVELSNLGRQILFRTSDLGRPKGEATIDSLKALNPEIQFEAILDSASTENLAALCQDQSILVEASDSFTTKFAVADQAVRQGIPCVLGAVLGFEGQVFVQAPDSACYRCLFESEPPPEAQLSCQRAGVLGALLGVIGSLQASEALKQILGIDPESSGTLFQIALQTSQFRKLKLHRRPDCQACAPDHKLDQKPPVRH